MRISEGLSNSINALMESSWNRKIVMDTVAAQLRYYAENVEEYPPAAMAAELRLQADQLSPPDGRIKSV